MCWLQSCSRVVLQNSASTYLGITKLHFILNEVKNWRTNSFSFSFSLQLCSKALVNGCAWQDWALSWNRQSGAKEWTLPHLISRLFRSWAHCSHTGLFLGHHLSFITLDAISASLSFPRTFVGGLLIYFDFHMPMWKWKKLIPSLSSRSHCNHL